MTRTIAPSQKRCHCEPQLPCKNKPQVILPIKNMEQFVIQKIKKFNN